MTQRRWLVSTVSGIGGLILGVAVGSGGPVEGSTEYQELSQAHETMRSELDSAQKAEADATARAAELEAEQKETDQALQNLTQREERLKEQSATLKERAAELDSREKAIAAPPKNDAPAATAPRGFVDAPQENKATDQRYGTCTELLKHPNSAPYRRGVDPEYDWYQDRDGDGLVCE